MGYISIKILELIFFIYKHNSSIVRLLTLPCKSVLIFQISFSVIKKVIFGNLVLNFSEAST